MHTCRDRIETVVCKRVRVFTAFECFGQIAECTAFAVFKLTAVHVDQLFFSVLVPLALDDLLFHFYFHRGKLRETWIFGVLPNLMFSTCFTLPRICHFLRVLLVWCHFYRLVHQHAHTHTHTH